MVKVTILDSGPEKNELNQNANGGTELMQNELYKRLDKDLLDNFQIICSRVRKVKDKQRILWCHDLADDGDVAHLKLRDGKILINLSLYQTGNFKITSTS